MPSHGILAQEKKAAEKKALYWLLPVAALCVFVSR